MLERSRRRPWEGKKVLITGGSSGIGKATARLLVQEGAQVWIVARGEARLREAEREIAAAARAGGGRIGASILDVSDQAAVARAMPQLLTALGGLDILINSAGIAHPGYVERLPAEVFESMMAVNYFGTVHPIRELLPHFMEQRSGHIINVSSVAGFMGVFGYTAYGASKAAVLGLSEALRQELRVHGVAVSVLIPPDTQTPQLLAEDALKPPETRALAGNLKIETPEAVAAALLSGMRARRLHIIVGGDSRRTHFLHRHVPWLVRWVMDRQIAKEARRNATAAE